MLQSIECEFIPNEGCEFGKSLANRHAGSIRVYSPLFCTATVMVLYGRQRGVGARKSLHSIFCGVYLLLPTRWNITKSDTSDTPRPYYVWNANVYISTVKKKKRKKKILNRSETRAYTSPGRNQWRSTVEAQSPFRRRWIKINAFQCWKKAISSLIRVKFGRRQFVVYASSILFSVF